jgi:hypothetical protein
MFLSQEGEGKRSVPVLHPDAAPTQIATQIAQAQTSQAQTPQAQTIQVMTTQAMTRIPAPIEVPAAPAEPLPAPGADRWGMVIPKMSRPAARPSEISLPEPPPKIADPAPRHLPTPDISVTSFIAPRFGSIERESSRKVPLSLGLGIGGGMVLVLAGAFFYTPAATPRQDSTPLILKAGPAVPVGPAQWIPLAQWPRHISMLRGSTGLTDFRMEFAGQINTKALGWIFRTQDSKNFYAMKLEIVNPGPAAAVVLKRFAVIDGRDQPVMQIRTTQSSRPGALYKIRTEGVGDHFTTWLGDKKIDEWTDARLHTGAAGLFSEAGESGTVPGQMAVMPLLRK